MDNAVKQRLSAHLHRCVNSLQQITPQNHSGTHDDNNNSNQRALLIPSRLPTGELALVLPNYNSFLAATPNSAFTAIKPPNDNNQRRFQPFQVEIPNSHLTAHISLPEGYDRRSPPATSPIKFDLLSESSQVSSTDGYDRFQSKPESYDRPRLMEDKRLDAHRLPTHQRSSELPERPLATQIHQKPNPNFVLNPKAHAQQKFIREPNRSRSFDSSEPPPKFARLSNHEARTSVIVTEAPRDSPPVNRPPGPRQDGDANQRDNMWRPW